MTEPTFAIHSGPAAQARLRRRYARERRFKLMCLGALGVAAIFLVVLIGSIVSRGWSGFLVTQMELTVTYSPDLIDADSPRDGNFRMIVVEGLQQEFPEATDRSAMRALLGLVSNGGFIAVRNAVVDDPMLIGQTVTLWVPAASDIDMLNKGYIDRAAPEELRRVDDQTMAWIDRLEADGKIRTGFNSNFFTTGDSREPELAGIGAAILGSFWMLLVTCLVSFPAGVCRGGLSGRVRAQAPLGRPHRGQYQQPRRGAVSIVFGLLGLAVFLNLMHLPRSAPLVGGLVLALMTLPTIIIAARAALKAVPPSIREAALGVGASPLQVVAHHVLPLAMPRMLTGRDHRHGAGAWANGAAADDRHGRVHRRSAIGPLDPATALPVQIYPLGRQPGTRVC